MHSACLAICKMNKLHKIIGQNIEHEQVIECFHQPLIMELHCTGMILCRPFWNSFLQMILQLFVLEGFQFSIHQQIISYSCNYFFQWVKCMRLKKSDLFRIFWAKPLEAPFPQISYISFSLLHICISFWNKRYCKVSMTFFQSVILAPIRIYVAW